MSSLMSKYCIQDQGPAEWFLGIRIIRNQAAQTILLEHDAYLNKLAAKFKVDQHSNFP